jgi:hypothetical protein
MRTAKQYAQLTRLNFRPEVEECPLCHRRLQRSCTLNRRIIVTCTRAVRVVHWGYRCPESTCPGRSIMYRSAAADTLALPGFTFGLDVLLSAGTLRLGEHRT